MCNERSLPESASAEFGSVNLASFLFTCSEAFTALVDTVDGRNMLPWETMVG